MTFIPSTRSRSGRGLALAALHVAYGEKILGSGPVYDSMAVDGKDAVLSFRDVGQGLEAKGGALTGFTVAGEDKKFHNATAEIKGDKVVVHSDEVEKPVAVRSAGPTSRSSTCGTRTACRLRRSARTTFRA